MNKVFSHIIILFLLSSSLLTIAQNDTLYHFKFHVKNPTQLNEISTKISIDQVNGQTIRAYANQREFDAFLSYNIAYTLIDDRSARKAISMATNIDSMTNWNKYPTYEVYVEMMQNFASLYPEICKLEQVGTLSSGRKLLAVKISDNLANKYEEEPKVLFTSSMHGDEIGGYVLMLRLIDYLLGNYNTDSTITSVINNTQIFINPLANPDGTYRSGNSTINGAIRYNGSLIDLNRNFPDASTGENPDGNSYQQETRFFMNFAEKYNFHLGMNIHAGSEVVNYPWDTWSKLAADDAWWRYVGGNYRDSAQANSPSGYFTDVNNGLTNGYAWYRITGGRQDYMNYYIGTREFTLEISTTKIYPTSSLPALWNYNKSAMLGYLIESQNGIQGTIFDTKGNPVKAKIEVLNYDKDKSEIYSDSLNGFFIRYLRVGTYNLKITADNYAPYYCNNVKVIDGAKTTLNIILAEPFAKLCLNTSLIEHNYYKNQTDSLNIPIVNCGNDSLTVNIKINNNDIENWLSLKSGSIRLASTQEKWLVLTCDSFPENDTTLNFVLEVRADCTYYIPIKTGLFYQTELEIYKANFYKLPENTSSSDSILLINNTQDSQTLNFESSDENWLNSSIKSNSILPDDSTFIYLSFDTHMLSCGFYKSPIFINNRKFDINLLVSTKPELTPIEYAKPFTIYKNGIFTKDLHFKKSGNGDVIIHAELSNPNPNIVLNQAIDTVKANDTLTIKLSITTDSLKIGNYINEINLASNFDTISIPIEFKLDSLPKLKTLTNQLLFNCYEGQKIKDSVLITNIGGGNLQLSLAEISTDFKYYLTIPNKTNPVASNTSYYLPVVVDGTNLVSGLYNTTLSVNETNIPVSIKVSTKPTLNVSPMSIKLKVKSNEQVTRNFYIKNTGDGDLEAQIQSKESSTWFQLSQKNITIDANSTKTISVIINTVNLTKGTYTDGITITTENGIYNLPIIIEMSAY